MQWARDLVVRRKIWVWLLPVAVFFGVRKEIANVTKGLEVLIGMAALVLIARSRVRSLSFLIVVLPFQTILLALLLRLGMPVFIVKGLRFWRELIVVGLAIAALRHLRARRLEEGRLRFDALDKIAFSYVLLGTVYLLFPGIFAGGTVGAHISFYARELGWRGDLLYICIFLACRHLGLTRRDIEMLFRRFVATGIVVALAGFYEFFATSSWLHVMNRVIRVPQYNVRVLHSLNPTIKAVYGSASSHHFPRIGSVLLDYLGAGFYLMIAFAIVVQLVSLRRQPWWISAGLPIIATGLLLNQGRAPIAGAILAVLVGLGSRIRHSLARRARFGLALGLAVVAAVPLLITFGLAHRFVGSHKSNAGHVSQTQLGLQTMGAHPLGRGLATAAGAGQNAADRGIQATATFLVSEDQWLQIGTQLGFLGLALYAATLILLAIGLTPGRSAEALLEGDELGLAARNALIGLFLAGSFLQTFINDQVDWPFFALCGAALALMDARRRQERAERALPPTGQIAWSLSSS
jgi:hypothetical protein